MAFVRLPARLIAYGVRIAARRLLPPAIRGNRDISRFYAGLSGLGVQSNRAIEARWYARILGTGAK